MATTIREDVTQYYVDTLTFPINNEAAGVPAVKYLISNRVKGITVENGSIHVLLGNKVTKILDNKTLSFRPVIVEGSPTSPISWLCGYDEEIKGMKVIGLNKTDLDPIVLPKSCRKP